MAGKRAPSNIPVTLLLLKVTAACLLFSHPVPSWSTTAADDHLPALADATALDEWVAQSQQDFKQRVREIASGIRTSLEPRILLAEVHASIITVRQDGTGDFRTVTEAVNSVPPGNSRRMIIKIGPGVYREKVTVDRTKPYLTFYGDPKEMPTISFNGRAAEFGTVQSATVAVESHYFVACNIIFENTAPKPADGEEGGQAVAMRISGDKAAFYNCNFFGFQDTLCDDRGRHFFKNCLIRGTVDFIFGNGRSIYLNCEIQSLAKGVTAITAQAREKMSDKGGFSFVRCKITGSGSAYLSRAWKDSSRVVFAYTYMGALIHPRGWDDKGDTGRDRTVFYGEYKCMGPGASTEGRVSFGRILTDDQAQPFLNMTFIRAATWLLPPPPAS